MKKPPDLPSGFFSTAILPPCLSAVSRLIEDGLPELPPVFLRTSHLHSFPRVSFGALNESLIFDESEVFPDEAVAVIIVLAVSEVGIASFGSSCSVYSPGYFRAILFFNSHFFFLHMPSNKLRSRVLSICLWLLIPSTHEYVSFDSPLINAFSIIYEKNNHFLVLIPLIAKGASASLTWFVRFLWFLSLFGYYSKPWFNAFVFGWFLQILLFGSPLTVCWVELRTIYDGSSKAVSSSTTMLLTADSAGESKSVKTMRVFRKKLPTFNVRAEFLKPVARNRVLFHPWAQSRSFV